MADSSSPGGTPSADLGWANTVTSGAAQQVKPAAWDTGGAAGAGNVQQVVRHGPGVPAGPAGQAVPTAEQVWRAGPPAAAPSRGRRARLIAGSAFSTALLIASVVVIFLRLHHGPFGVTGVAITGQARSGCTVDVTGRISTNGAAGTVSYQWTFQQQAAQPMSQSAAAGESVIYVTAAMQGQGHGSVTQTVTLRVLSPDQGTASVPVTVSC